MSSFNPIKLKDGELITRKILNFDTLNGIITDSYFHNEYKNAVLSTQKLSKAVKDRFVADELFRQHYLIISLLINTSRINTTLAFYLETKTALRCYHPIPCLRQSQQFFGDSPRLKNILNSTIDYSCTSLLDVQLRVANGVHPPTSLINFIFILFNSASVIDRDNMHSGFSLHHLIWPTNIPSKQATRAFLWIVYHYYSKRSDDVAHVNPYDDDYSRSNYGKCPLLYTVPDDQLASENVDSHDDIEWGLQRQQKRIDFVNRLPPSAPPPNKKKRGHSRQSSAGESDQDDDDQILIPSTDPTDLLSIATRDALTKPLDDYSNSTSDEPLQAISRKLDIIKWIGGES